MKKPAILSIGTTHPWNIAGTGVDARVAAEYAVRNFTAITAVTAQDEGGIRMRFALPLQLLRAQFMSMAGLEIAAVRVGAVPEAESLREVLRFLASRSDVPAVVDPAFDASLGGALVEDAAVEIFRENLLAAPVILTPNIPEAERLTGRGIAGEDEMIEAAHLLRARGARAVLLKGGHLQGDPVDVLVTATELKIYRQAREPVAMRGTGCVLAAALACELALGRDLIAAVDSAREYVRAKIAAQTRLASLRVAF